MPYFTLSYQLADDYMQKREPVRGLHFEHITPYHKAGKLIYGGAYDDPAEGALLIFKTEYQEEIEDFAQRDPYVINGVVTSYQVRPWNVAIGHE